ncbi:MAG: hypothetical protein ABFS19_07105 [Thermodesulfobacteriota bacterium]
MPGKYSCRNYGNCLLKPGSHVYVTTLLFLLLSVFGLSAELTAEEKPILIGGSLSLTGKYAKMGDMKCGIG